MGDESLGEYENISADMNIGTYKKKIKEPSASEGVYSCTFSFGDSRQAISRFLKL